MKNNLYKSVVTCLLGAGMTTLNSCTDLSETIYTLIPQHN